MEEFLRTNYSLLNRSVELLAAFTGLIVYKKFSKSYTKYFIWFLISVIFIETLGSYPKMLKSLGVFHLIDNTIIERNYWWFNLIWSFSSSLFMSWYLLKVNTTEYYQRVIKYLRYVFIALVLSYILYDYTAIFYATSYFIIIASAILVGFSSFLLFLDFLISDKILEFYKDINFYIASVLFIWYLITTCLDFYEIYFNENDKDFITLKYLIFLLCNIFMYVSFSVALLYCKPQEINTETN